MLLATWIFNRYKEEKLTYYLENKNYLILHGYLDIWFTRAKWSPMRRDTYSTRASWHYDYQQDCSKLLGYLVLITLEIEITLGRV